MKKYLLLFPFFISFVNFAQNDLILDWAFNIKDSLPQPGVFNCSAVAINNTNETYVCGYFSGGGDFDPSGSPVIFTSNGNSDAFLAKYDAAGNYLWAFKLGAFGEDRATSLSIDSNGDVIVVGRFEGSIDINPLGVSSLLTSNGQADIFVLKYNPSGLLTWGASYGGAFDDDVNSVVLDVNDNIFITGNISDTTDFNQSVNLYELIPFTAKSQYLVKFDSNGDIEWGHIFDAICTGNAKCIGIDNSSNIILTGVFTSTTDFDPSMNNENLTSSGGDIFIAKYDNSGFFLWAKNIESWGIRCNAIAVDSNDDIVISGTFFGMTDFDPSSATVSLFANSEDIYMAKYDVNGNYTWVKTLSNFDSNGCTDLAIDGLNNIYLTGSFSNTLDFDPTINVENLVSNGYSDSYLAKYDPSGNYLWANSFGDVNFDSGSYITTNGSNEPILAGVFSGTVDFDPSASFSNINATNSSLFISKYTALGTFNSVFGIGLLGDSEAYQNITNSDTDSDGNLYVICSFEGVVDLDPSINNSFVSFQGHSSSFLAKYDSSGVFIWGFPLVGTDQNIAWDVVTDENDEVIITGSFQGSLDFNPLFAPNVLTSAGFGDAFLAKYNSAGELMWVNQIGSVNGDTGFGVSIDESNNIILGGSFAQTVDFDPSINNASLTTVNVNPDSFIAKYTTDGDYLWAVNFEDTNGNYCKSVAVDDDNNIYGIGWLQNTTDFDPSPGVANVSTNGSTDNFLVKLDSNGNYQWAFAIGGPYYENCYDVVVDNNNDVLMTGFFTGTADFNPNGNPVVKTSSGFNDMFLCKYADDGELIWANTYGGSGNQTDIAFDIEVDGFNNYFMTGQFKTTIDFDTLTPLTYLTSNGNFDAFLAKFNENGINLWAHNFGSYSHDIGGAVSIDQYQNIYFTGASRLTTQFNTVGPVVELTANNDVDAFIVKYHERTYVEVDTSSNLISENELPYLSIYPNPTKGSVFIKFIETQERIIRVYSIQGELMSELYTINEDLVELSVPETEGIYLLEIITGVERTVHKVIKQ